MDGVQAEEEAGARYERLWDAVWIQAREIISEVLRFNQLQPCFNQLFLTTEELVKLTVTSSTRRVNTEGTHMQEKYIRRA